MLGYERTLSREQVQDYVRALEFAEHQVSALLDRFPDFRPTYTQDGRWHHHGELWTDWADGFTAGLLWQFYARTKSPGRRQQAQHYSRLLELREVDRNIHALGFLFLPSYVPWFDLTGDPELLEVIHQAAKTLAQRFVERGRYLCSFVGIDSLFIDIMMNVPLLFYAAEKANDPSLCETALAHCRTSRDRLVRPDGSTAHEAVFHLLTGEFLRESTRQGLSPDSCWSRGLAWSMYGFSRVYAQTGLEEFLEVAERNAAYWIANVPHDKVPLWDFAAEHVATTYGLYRDSSAAAVAASALIDLAGQTKSEERAAAYWEEALATLDVLISPAYLAANTPGWEGVLQHAVYQMPKHLGVDESVIWGDYYFVEALTKLVTSA